MSDQNTGHNSLSVLGWDDHFQSCLENYNKDDIQKAGYRPARVVGVEKNHFLISRGHGDELARTAGRMMHRPDNMFPVIGDWVMASDGLISAVLPRKTVLSRNASGSRGSQDGPDVREQIIAANLDTVFIVCGMDRDFNLRRMERYITLVYNCGLSPVIVLTKADLHDDPAPFVQEVEEIAFGVPVHPVSAGDDAGPLSLAPYISQGKTIAMVGSSGAGKSTLLNRLYGEDLQPTAAVSTLLGKGRHTTTSRSLIPMPQGGMIIDNPGIREIGFAEEGEGIHSAFPDIEALAQTCRFHDCSHTHEPGCSVLDAVADGKLPRQRLDSYRKMEREMAYLSQRRTKTADRVEKERWKGVALKIRSVNKNKYNN
ncbi:MAG: ribosome small subunit-dependent GTPase A [Desulfobacter sp.]|nr:MAG: ribosome small subunit-dependent GTPase A [Desulfobacter sp.]